MTRDRLPSTVTSRHVMNARAVPPALTRAITRRAATRSRLRSSTDDLHALKDRYSWKLPSRLATRRIATRRSSALTFV